MQIREPGTNLQTQLLGVRVEAIIERPDGNRVNRVTGVIQTVALASPEAGFVVMIEDDEGVLHTRTSHWCELRVLPGQLSGDLYATMARAMGIDRDEAKRRFLAAAYGGRLDPPLGEATKPRTIVAFRDLKIGAAFQWLDPLDGWAKCKLVKLDKSPGWAMPDGWGFILADYRQVLGEHLCILLDEKAPMPAAPPIPMDEDLP